jgi:hypothetical protein
MYISNTFNWLVKNLFLYVDVTLTIIIILAMSKGSIFNRVSIYLNEMDLKSQ